MKHPRVYLVAYDIRAPRRLRRVADTLSDWGIRIQWSVFVVEADGRRLAKLTARLKRLVAAEDDLRIYLVPDPPRGRWRGPLPQEALGLYGSAAASLPDRLRLRDP